MRGAALDEGALTERAEQLYARFLRERGGGTDKELKRFIEDENS